MCFFSTVEEQHEETTIERKKKKVKIKQIYSAKGFENFSFVIVKSQVITILK
jgi:hypothetical protein